eukprot:TRINITY_DN2169_c0_g2_i1.p6 TRINITY_DN2169_c0_g2~~TRINITY_DN2169_c0_g2_i1.p6  ORF type:complete len:174 (-),score=20.66 TRINITY_DN2169_c0_g2_i1:1346-1867(-)
MLDCCFNLVLAHVRFLRMLNMLSIQVVVILLGVGMSIQQQDTSHLFFNVTFIESSCADEVVLNFVDFLNDRVGCQRCTKLFTLDECGEKQVVVNYRVSNRGLDIVTLQMLYNTIRLVPRCLIAELGLSSGKMQFGNVTIQPKMQEDFVLPICEDALLEEFDAFYDEIQPYSEN